MKPKNQCDSKISSVIERELRPLSLMVVHQTYYKRCSWIFPLRGLRGGLAYRSDGRFHPATLGEIQFRILNMRWITRSAACLSD
jgi:hypothetical protein